MSLIDELKGLEDRVAERMKELRPLVDEYRELEQVAAEARRVRPPPPALRTAQARRDTEAVGCPLHQLERRAPVAPPALVARRVRHRGPQMRRRPARHARAAMAAATSCSTWSKRGPGITVREVGSELGVDPTSLYRIVHRLEQDGALEKRGRELMPR